MSDVPRDSYPEVRSRLAALELLARGSVKGRPFEPDALLSWVLAGSADHLGRRLTLGTDLKLEVLGQVAKLAGIQGLLGTSASLIEAACEILAWMRDPILRPIPRHYEVEVFDPRQLDEIAKVQRTSFRPKGKKVRVANPPATWWTTSLPEDAL